MSVNNAQQANDIFPEHLLNHEALATESGTAFLDAATHITCCDPSFLQMVGKTMQECRQVSITQLFPALAVPEPGKTDKLRQKIVYRDNTLMEAILSPMLDIHGEFAGYSLLLNKPRKVLEKSQSSAIDIPFQTILEAIPHLAWTARTDGGVSYVNHKWADYTGKQVHELLEWGWQPFIHPDDIERVLHKWKQAMQTGEKYECEYRFKKKPEGIYRWLLGRALPIRNETGQITLWVGTCTDIHDQKRTEEALENRVQERTLELSTAIEELNSMNEQLYQEIELRRKLDTVLEEQKAFTDKITDLMPCLITVYNINTGKYIYVNNAIAPMLGYSRESLLEQGVALLVSLMHPDEAESLMASNQEALQKSNARQAHDPEAVVDFEYRLRNHNGEWRWLHTSGTVFDRDASGKVAHVLNVSIDITDKKEAQVKFQESRHLVEQIASATPDMLYIFDIKAHKNLYANRGMEQLLGYTQAEMQRMGEKLFPAIMHPHDLAKVPDNVRRLHALKNGDVFENQFRLKNAAGDWRWFQSREVTFKRDSAGKVIHILGSSQDITERKQAEQELEAKQHFIEQIANTIPNIIYIYNLQQQKITYTNREIYKTLGYSPELVQEMGAGFLPAFTYPDDYPRLMEAFQTSAISKEEEVINVEYRIKHANGNWLWFYDRYTVFNRSADGRVLEIMGISQDITGIKLATEEIRAKNKIIVGILSRLPVLITRIDKKGTILEATGSALRSLGLADNEIAGVNVFTSYPQIASYVQQALQGKAITFMGTPERNGKKRHFLNNYFYDAENENAIGFSIDITEQKQAEEQLKESEARLIQLNEELEKRVSERTRDLAISQERYEIASYVTHDAIWDWNLLTDQLTYSKGYTTIFGYNPDETLHTIEEWTCRIHPDDKDRIVDHIQRVIDKGEQLWSDEYRHQRKDGSYAYVFDRGFVQQDAQGKPIRMVGAMADISERKLAEETILRSEAKFRRIFESDMLGIFLWNVNGHVSDANDKFLHIIGYTREDMLSGKLNWRDLTPKKHAHLDEISIEQFLTAGNSIPYEKEYIRKDGSLVPILIGGILLNRDINQGVAYVLDITEQKKAQQNLAISEERFRLVTRATNDAVRDWNLQTDVIWWNEGFKNMFGYQPGEIEIGPESWYSRIHPDDLEGVLQKIHQVIDSAEEQWSDEYRFRRADGTYAYILDRTYILYNEHGKAIRMLGSMVDVTYMKEIQEALEQQAAELKQSNADLEQFAFISSHDLQEPLNTAASFAKLLERKYKPILDTDGQEFIEFIVASTDRMKMLIRSLLDYSKINAVAKSYEPANLSDLAKVSIDNLQARILQTGAQVIVEDLPIVPVVAPQIVQLFQNLISNAIKFKSTFPPEIHISATEHAEHVVIRVQDNGIGMEMKYAGKIFQVFQRLHSRDEYEGAGIGLATCKRIVERHHGDIWVESIPGKGSTFFFTLRK